MSSFFGLQLLLRKGRSFSCKKHSFSLPCVIKKRELGKALSWKSLSDQVLHWLWFVRISDFSSSCRFLRVQLVRELDLCFFWWLSTEMRCFCRFFFYLRGKILCNELAKALWWRSWKNRQLQLDFRSFFEEMLSFRELFCKFLVSKGVVWKRARKHLLLPSFELDGAAS